MHSLWDSNAILNQYNCKYADNIETHMKKVIYSEEFLVLANSDPKGNWSKVPQDQDPDMLQSVMKKTDATIVV